MAYYYLEFDSGTIVGAFLLWQSILLKDLGVLERGRLGQDFQDGLTGQLAEGQDAAPAEQGIVEAERRVFRRGADQGQRPVLHVG